MSLRNLHIDLRKEQITTHILTTSTTNSEPELESEQTQKQPLFTPENHHKDTPTNDMSVDTVREGVIKLFSGSIMVQNYGQR